MSPSSFPLQLPSRTPSRVAAISSDTSISKAPTHGLYAVKAMSSYQDNLAGKIFKPATQLNSCLSQTANNSRLTSCPILPNPTTEQDEARTGSRAFSRRDVSVDGNSLRTSNPAPLVMEPSHCSPSLRAGSPVRAAAGGSSVDSRKLRGSAKRTSHASKTIWTALLWQDCEA